jgi:DNA repair protein RadC
LERARTERFVVVALDARNRPVRRYTVASGSLSTVAVHPREVFGRAIVGHAAAVILAHNHPSGDQTPSPDDERVTERLAACGRILGIPVLDHLIISRAGYYSFRDAGCIGEGMTHHADDCRIAGAT